MNSLLRIYCWLQSFRTKAWLMSTYCHLKQFFFFSLCIIYSEFDGVLLDYSRQRATNETVDKLFKLAEVCLFDI